MYTDIHFLLLIGGRVVVAAGLAGYSSSGGSWVIPRPHEIYNPLPGSGFTLVCPPSWTCLEKPSKEGAQEAS